MDGRADVPIWTAGLGAGSSAAHDTVTTSGSMERGPALCFLLPLVIGMPSQGSAVT